jgi:adenylosuccinate synthase
VSAIVILGAQWGDEGKGKITDYLADKASAIARFQGVNNAGHTIVTSGVEYKFHLIPSGILYPDKICALGNGVVIDPAILLGEIENLRLQNLSVDNLRISPNAHLIMPYHVRLDHIEEESRSSADSIGTTKRGIGPCYADKAARLGIRLQDALNKEELENKISKALQSKRAILGDLVEHELAPAKIAHEYHSYALLLEPFITDISVLLWEAIERGETVICEGAQGALLDIDHGTYPFVTSSNCTTGAVCTGTGINPLQITQVWGVAKAYATRIDTVGPFPSAMEQGGPIEQDLVDRGKEYGTTTGRRRRCGWMDLVALKRAIKLNGITDLALTKLDIMQGIDPLRVVTGYRLLDGSITQEYPYDHETLNAVEPIFIDLPGFDEDISSARNYQDLPEAAQNYISRIALETKTPVSMVGVGQSREQIITL